MAIAHRSDGRRAPDFQRETIDGWAQSIFSATSEWDRSRTFAANTLAPSDWRFGSMDRSVVPTGTGVNWHRSRAGRSPVPSDTDVETFADRLSAAVKNSGLTQGEVARRVNDAAGTDWIAGYVGRLMSGKRKAKTMSPEAVLALPHVLGVEARWLWLGEGHMVRVPQPRYAGGAK